MSDKDLACEHGRQRRKCEVCELIAAENRIAELEFDKQTLKQDRDVLQAKVKELELSLAALSQRNTELVREVQSLSAVLHEAHGGDVMHPADADSTREANDG